MLVSYNWLQKYFKEKLPKPKDVANALTQHAFEVEGVTKKDEDSILDFKVWTDRAHYALSHRGVAGEIAAILNLKQEPIARVLGDGRTKNLAVGSLQIKIEENEMCPRYIGRRIENIKVGESPSWIKEKLEVLGQRSINSIVDVANYVMLDMGQPLHAFDADKVVGGITVRFAQKGEKMTTLDNKEITLDSTMLVIADDEGPLALAGIKGGKKAEVTGKTKNLIIEAANFDPSLIRRTSLKVGLKTDASKRYENGITSKFAEIGMAEISSLISELNKEAKVGEMIDVYSKPEVPFTLSVSASFINEVLGEEIKTSEMVDILERIKIDVKEKGDQLALSIPPERLDLRSPEDIAEEIGRIYGYENISGKDLERLDGETKINKTFYYSEKIKDILVSLGFSEVMTSSLSSKGDLEIEKSASDKNFLRINLSDNISKSLETNLYNAPLLGLDQIKIFEIGSVFPKAGEHMSLCIGIANTKGYKARPDGPVGRGESANEEVRQIREHLLSAIDSKVTTLCTIDDTGGLLVLKGKQIGKINDINGVMELNLDMLIGALPDVLEARLPETSGSRASKYKAISSYPFILRDIAVFVPGEKGKEEEVLNVIKNEATDLLVRVDIFDVFTKKKDGEETKTSYAYRLVFQSPERTLTDSEINAIMAKISSVVATKGWEVR